MLPLLFFLVLALLVPIALYCLALALVNRRPNPVMVNGVWDCVGLLFAGSGLLLIVGPVIINMVYAKAVGEAANGRLLAQVWSEYWGITIAYYAAVILGIAGLLWLRRDKTVIYNVDPDRLETVLAQTLNRLGLRAVRSGRQIRIGGGHPALPGSDLPPGAFRTNDSGIVALEAALEATPAHRAWPSSEASSEDSSGLFVAVVEIDVFRPLANVTLHWRGWHDPKRLGWRRQIEDELARNLELAARGDNPAVTWLLGISTAIFGLLFLAVLLLILLSERTW